MDIRQGTPADVDAVAALHTESWRTAYAGIMPAAYLDGPLLDERLTLWRDRLAGRTDTDSCLLVTGDGGAIDGFAYLARQGDGRVLLDNLHVSPALKRSGIGHRLMDRAFAWAAAHHPGKPVYLEVLRDNAPARAFYERLGGRVTKEFVERLPAGDLPVVEYTWILVENGQK